MTDTGYIFEATDGAPIKHWTRGVQLEHTAHQQLRRALAMLDGTNVAAQRLVDSALNVVEASAAVVAEHRRT